MSVNRLVSLRSLFLCLICLIGGSGCSTPPSRFYLLEPVPDQANNETFAQSSLLIALAPVRIPKYADRPQIVTATDQNVYQLNEFNRWAEALDENITRVLAKNLTVLVPAEVLLTRASSFSKQADFQVSAQILEFYIDPQGQAAITAQWLISKNDKRLLSRQATYLSPASTEDYPIMVSALNNCLNRLSRDIAISLQKTVAERSAR